MNRALYCSSLLESDCGKVAHHFATSTFPLSWQHRKYASISLLGCSNSFKLWRRTLQKWIVYYCSSLLESGEVGKWQITLPLSHFPDNIESMQVYYCLVVQILLKLWRRCKNESCTTKVANPFCNKFTLGSSKIRSVIWWCFTIDAGESRRLLSNKLKKMCFERTLKQGGQGRQSDETFF